MAPGPDLRRLSAQVVWPVALVLAISALAAYITRLPEVALVSAPVIGIRTGWLRLPVFSPASVGAILVLTPLLWLIVVQRFFLETPFGIAAGIVVIWAAWLAGLGLGRTASIIVQGRSP